MRAGEMRSTLEKINHCWQQDLGFTIMQVEFAVGLIYDIARFKGLH